MSEDHDSTPISELDESTSLNANDEFIISTKDSNNVYSSKKVKLSLIESSISPTTSPTTPPTTSPGGGGGLGNWESVERVIDDSTIYTNNTGSSIIGLAEIRWNQLDAIKLFVTITPSGGTEITIPVTQETNSNGGSITTGNYFIPNGATYKFSAISMSAGVEYPRTEDNAYFLVHNFYETTLDGGGGGGGGATFSTDWSTSIPSAHSEVTYTHNLGTEDIMYKVYVRDASGKEHDITGGEAWAGITNANCNCVNITSNQITIKFLDAYLDWTTSSAGANPTERAWSTATHIKVLAFASGGGGGAGSGPVVYASAEFDAATAHMSGGEGWFCFDDTHANVTVSEFTDNTNSLDKGNSSASTNTDRAAKFTIAEAGFYQINASARISIDVVTSIALNLYIDGQTSTHAKILANFGQVGGENQETMVGSHAQYFNQGQEIYLSYTCSATNAPLLSGKFSIFKVSGAGGVEGGSVEVYRSAETEMPITNTTLPFTHNLGQAPDYITHSLVCQNDEHGYVAGDEIHFAGSYSSSQGWITFTADDSEIKMSAYYTHAANGPWYVDRRGTPNAANYITRANWKVIVRGYSYSSSSSSSSGGGISAGTVIGHFYLYTNAEYQGSSAKDFPWTIDLKNKTKQGYSTWSGANFKLTDMVLGEHYELRDQTTPTEWLTNTTDFSGCKVLASAHASLGDANWLGSGDFVKLNSNYQDVGLHNQTGPNVWQGRHITANSENKIEFDFGSSISDAKIVYGIIVK